MAGLLLSFEGTDGSGKTTQINLLREWLMTEGHTVAIFREPGGSRVSEAIRSLLLNPDYTEMQAETELMLYTASRLQLLGEEILPALASGTVVIMDRFADSTTAYQGHGRQISLDLVASLNAIIRQKAWPLRTWWLDLDPDAASARTRQRNQRADRLEAEKRDFFVRVREGYRCIHKAEPNRVMQLNALLGREVLAEQIRNDFLELNSCET